jgi:glyoxylase-like metal-dependent hydrolase (beta-lactamase superfamily II)
LPRSVSRSRISTRRGDFDQIQGLHTLREQHPDLLLYLHPADWPIVEEEDAYRNASYLYGTPFLPFDARGFQLLEHGQLLRAGDTELTVHHTPGHMEGSVSLLGEVDGHAVLFAGAMKALNGAIVERWVEAVATWQRSVQALAALEFDWVLNEHEPVETLPIPRSVVDRLLASFGMMMNPWFTLGHEEPANEIDLIPVHRLVPAPG